MQTSRRPYRRADRMNASELYTKINGLTQSAKTEFQENIEYGIKKSITHSQAWRGIRYAAFSSLFVKMAFERSDSAKKAGSRSTYNAPAWESLTKDINNEISAISSQVEGFFVNASVSWQSVAQFSTLATVKDGSRTEIYHKFAFFIYSVGQRGFFQREYFSRSLTGDEAAVIDMLPRAIENCLDGLDHENANSGMGLSPTAQGDATVEGSIKGQAKIASPTVPRATVSVNFQLKAERLADLGSFCDRFSFGTDGHVHAVVYRPRLSNPSVLMKTFLAIKTPTTVDDVVKSSYVFTHVYKPDLSMKNERIASGKVIPLEEAVYFIGGQGPLIKSSGEDKHRMPFRSSKVIVVRWEDIVQHHVVFPGVAISMSGSGRVISSRVAIRLTPIDHSDNIKLREVHCDALLGDLKADLDNEDRIVSEIISDPLGEKGGSFRRNAYHFMKRGSDEEAREIARTILGFANNAPGRDFRVVLTEPFSDAKGAPLRSSALVNRLDAALRENPGPYKNEMGEELDIWRHLRFGPLQID